MSRADLARVTGLRASTVSAIIGSLIEDGWLTRGYRAQSVRGRRPTNISLNESHVALAIDLRPEHANVALIDVSGTILKRDQFTFDAPGDSRPQAQKVFRRVIAAAQAMLKAHSRMAFHGVGVSVSGRVNPQTRRLAFSPNSLWMQIDLRGEIQKVLGSEIEIDNAANACVVAEQWFGDSTEVSNLIALSVSEGIGAGLLIDGRLLRGEDGLAGEFGHMPFDESGPLCGCGNRGCWETWASSRAGVRYYREMVPSSKVRRFREVLDLAIAGDAAALKCIDKMTVAIAKGLAVLSVGLSPSSVLIVGECTALWDRMRPILEQQLAARSIAARIPKLVAAVEGDTARLRGAAALVFQKVLFRGVEWR